MRNCCSQDLLDPRTHVRDFHPLWLDEHLDYLIRPKVDREDYRYIQKSGTNLLEVVTQFLSTAGGSASSRDIGRDLKGKIVNGRDVLSQLKEDFYGLRDFFASFPEQFRINYSDDEENLEFFVSLVEEPPDAKQDGSFMDAKIGAEEARDDDDGSDDDGIEDADGEAESGTSVFEVVTHFLSGAGGSASSRDLGRDLKGKIVDGRDVLSQLKEEYTGLHAFFQTFPEQFRITHSDDEHSKEFFVSLVGDAERDGQTVDDDLEGVTIVEDSFDAKLGTEDADGAAELPEILSWSRVGRGLGVGFAMVTQILEGSFSAVSKPIFASKGSCCSIFQAPAIC